VTVRPHSRGRRLAHAALLAAVLLTASTPAFALNPTLDLSQYAHTAWRVRDGFFKARVTSFAQTTDGYLWLGTEFGLLRFDGVRFVPWRPPSVSSLPNEWIRYLLGTRDGTLWIGTLGGLARLKDGLLTQYAELAGQTVDSLLEDRRGTVWVVANRPGSPRARLCAILNGRPECHGEDGSLGRFASSLVEDSSGHVWFTTTAPKGLLRWAPDPPKFYSLNDQPGGGLEVLADDGNGALLLVTDKGISRFAEGKTATVPFPTTQSPIGPRIVLRDRDGGVWIGTHRGLVHVHHGRTTAFERSDGLSGDDVGRLFEDREGNIWATTNDGIDRFREPAAALLSESQGLSHSSASTVLAARDGSVWIGTALGLNRWRDGRVTVYREPSDRPARSASQAPPASGVRELVGSGLPRRGVGTLFEDARGRLWVGTAAGLGYMEDDRFVPVTSAPQILNAIAEDARGNLWIADQNRGLLRLAPNHEVQETPTSGLGHADFITRLAADAKQAGLWLGFLQGGVAYYTDGRIRASYSASDGLGQGRVTYLHADPDGTLWVATEGGLSRLRNGRAATLSSKSGLPCDGVDWMTDDGAGSVWLSMACGIARVARSELDEWAAGVDQNQNVSRTIHPTVFDSADGVRSAASLSNYSPHVTRSADGRLWFTAYDGVTILDPRHLPFNNLPPPVHIEQITADRKSYEVPSDPAVRLELPALIRDVQIDYTALSLVAPEKMQFRYKLEGLEADWQEVGTRRQAFYSGLPPRNYRFRVIASNNSGVWNEAGASLDFTVLPAYYQRMWFRVSVVTALFASIVMLYRLRVRQLAGQFNMRLEARVNERTRIARDLHDTLLQNFQGVLLNFQAATFKLPEGPSDARTTLDDAIERASQAITEARDAVQGLRSSTGVTSDLARAIGTLGDDLTDRSNHDAPDFSVEVEGKPRDLAPILGDEVYRIAGEALRNAFRHAQARRIEAEIHYDRKQFRLRIRDDGKGIDPHVLDGGGRNGHYGLAGMHERATVVGGTLTIWSERESGTEIELTIPAALAYSRTERPS
jgi:signal transduction histidine kinase/ligand-binding sensor domain-containing protein